MKHLKTFEEVGWIHAAALIINLLNVTIWITLFILKKTGHFPNMRKRVLDELENPHYKMPKMRRVGDKVEIFRTKLFNEVEEENLIEINTKTRLIKYCPISGWETKVSQKELNIVLQKLSKFKSQEEDLSNILQDIKDDFNYSFVVSNGSINMNKFSITLTKEGTSIIDRWENKPPKNFIHRDGIKEVIDLGLSIEEAISRIEDEYGVKIVDSIPKYHIIDSLIYILHKRNDKLKLKGLREKENAPISSRNSSDHTSLFDVDFEILSFVPYEMHMIFEKEIAPKRKFFSRNKTN